MTTPHEELQVVGPRVQATLLALEATELTTEQRSLVDLLHRDALRAAYIAADALGTSATDYFDDTPPEGAAERGGHDKEKPGEEPEGGG